MAVAPCPVIPKGHSSSWIIIEERHVGSARWRGACCDTPGNVKGAGSRRYERFVPFILAG